MQKQTYNSILGISNTLTTESKFQFTTRSVSYLLNDKFGPCALSTLFGRRSLLHVGTSICSLVSIKIQTDLPAYLFCSVHGCQATVLNRTKAGSGLEATSLDNNDTR